MDDTTPLLVGQDSTQSLTSFKGSTELDHAEESHGTKRPVCVTSYRAVFFVVVFVHSRIVAAGMTHSARTLAGRLYSLQRPQHEGFLRCLSNLCEGVLHLTYINNMCAKANKMLAFLMTSL